MVPGGISFPSKKEGDRAGGLTPQAWGKREGTEEAALIKQQTSKKVTLHFARKKTPTSGKTER